MNKVTQYTLSHVVKSFEDIAGQKHITNELRERSIQDKYPTAMLFQGPTGVGKTTTALVTAASMQCMNKTPQGDPCGECSSCKDIFNKEWIKGSTIMLDGGTASSKDDVIEMINRCAHSRPTIGKKHVIIIEEIDQLSTGAKNALHKILEKPSPYIHFILLSMTELNGNKVPASIKDRCQPYNFKPVSETATAFAMKQMLEKEGIWCDLPQEFIKEGFFLIVNNSGGSLRRAYNNLERCIMAKFFTVDEIEENLGFLSEDTVLRTFEALIKGKADDFIGDLENMRNKRTLIEFFNLTNYFLLKYEENSLVTDPQDNSPSTHLLNKVHPLQIVELVDIYAEIQDYLTKGYYTSPTTLARIYLKGFKKIKHVKKPNVQLRR